MQKRKYHDFSFKIFVSQHGKISLGKLCVCQKISGGQKFYAFERGVSSFFVKNFLSHSTEKNSIFVMKHFVFSEIFVHHELLCNKRGISLNSIDTSLHHSANKTRSITILCFKRILVSKNFKQRRGETSRFCRKIFFISHD